jgi:FtsP/CotA-like multicopper oxidase with cupredoxin domain
MLPTPDADSPIAAADSATAVGEAPAPTAFGSLSRRGFLRAATVAGGGVLAAGLAACTGAAAPGWQFGSPTSSGHDAPAPSGSAPASPAASAPAASAPAASHVSGSAAPSDAPADHDAAALAAVKRFLGGEATQLPAPNPPLTPNIDGSTKVFDLTIDDIQHRIDAQKAPVAALGFNGLWTGPLLRVVEGDRVRAVFRNNLHESTGIHFHGQALPNPMDGVPHVTQDPIQPGESFTYEFVAKPAGSHMYHSHHNATDQVGRGLLGAFIVDPKDPAERYDRKYGVTQDIVWISNDTIGGFTINGRGFPATYPITAKRGETILIRFMNEGIMSHPWHVHGLHFRVVARDGYPLGPAEFRCDTLGVNPGERYDAIIDCDNPGVWAFHCHILPHAEGRDGMFGMVTALVVE